jgi:hypothetical protein
MSLIILIKNSCFLVLARMYSNTSNLNNRTPSNANMNTSGYYERQNDEQMDLLANKVSALKSVRSAIFRSALKHELMTR